MKTKKTKNNRHQFGNKFYEKTKSALFFLQLIEVDCSWLWFFDRNLKHKQKVYLFFPNKFNRFLLSLVSLDFVFCVFDQKNRLWGTQTNYNQFEKNRLRKSVILSSPSRFLIFKFSYLKKIEEGNPPIFPQFFLNFKISYLKKIV